MTKSDLQQLERELTRRLIVLLAQLREVQVRLLAAAGEGK